MLYQERKPPFKSYTGTEPYLFVSYAHVDANWVYPKIEWLHECGIRIWFDEGITGGATWTAEVASFLEKSAGVLFFASPDSVASRNVNNELHFAIDSELPLLIVSEEPQLLPAGLRLALGPQQAVIRGDLSLAGFQGKLINSIADIFGIDVNQESAAKDNLSGIDAQERTSIAVMPFRNQSLDNEDDLFLAQGMAEILVYALQSLRMFSVISSESTQSYNPETDLRRAAKDLSADFVISGTLRRSKSRLRVTVSMMDSRTALQIWSKRYDCNEEDVFELEDRLAREIVAAIEPEVVLQEMRRASRLKTQDKAAWDLFLEGQWQFNSMTFEGFSKARDLWTKAREMAPNFAQPVAGLGGVAMYSLLHHRGRFSDTEAEQLRKEGLRFAKEAVALDPSYPIGHIALVGFMIHQGMYEQALNTAIQAQKMCPASFKVHECLAFSLMRSGKFEEAIKEYDKAERLSPRDPGLPELYNQRGACHFFLGAFSKALEQAETSLNAQPHYVWPHIFRVLCYYNMDSRDMTLGALQDFAREVPDFHIDQLLELDPALGSIFIEGLQVAGWQPEAHSL
ncbi:MAG: tetratricopeptide repeat protein [Halioglobus sp.]